MENVVLHRCPMKFMKGGWHGCHVVEKALDEQGIDYELRTAPMRKGKRTDVHGATGQGTVPAIEFADGTGYRAEGKDMAAEIRAGRLFEHQGDVPSA